MAGDLAESDILQQIVKFGVDIYPPVDFSTERTRLSLFFDEARSRYPQLYSQLVSGNDQFKISGEFHSQGLRGPRVQVETFVMTTRGPVFVFPVRLPEIGDTGLDDDYVTYFDWLRKKFLEALPGRILLRVGLVREVIFSAGSASWNHLITKADNFSGAGFVTGQKGLFYQDAYCGIRITLDIGKLMRTTQHPVGQTIGENAGNAVIISVDVHNSSVGTGLSDEEISKIIERAESVWPEGVLESINGGF